LREENAGYNAFSLARKSGVAISAIGTAGGIDLVLVDVVVKMDRGDQ
jgi:hypothetical protein